MRYINECRRKAERKKTGYIAVQQDIVLAQHAIWELLHYKLRVILIPAERKNFASHSVRAVDQENVNWYKQFHALKNSNPGMLKRRIINALSRVLSHNYIRSNSCAWEVLEYLKQYNDPREWGFKKWK